MENIIRVGLAGFGMSGQVFQAPFITANPHFSLCKVYERTKNLSQEEYPQVTVVRSFEELLTDDIDLVVLSTPNGCHVQQARQCILAGKAVITEKPTAATSQEVLELCALAKERGVLYSVYQNRRWDSDFLTVKRLIEDGSFGEVVDYEAHYDRFARGRNRRVWRWTLDKGHDVVYDLGVHILDQAYCLFGMPKEVYADFRSQRQDSFGVDNFQIILYYDRLRAILSASELVTQQGPHFMVNGTKATFIKYGEDTQERQLLSGLRPVNTPNWGEDAPENYGKLYVDNGTGIDEVVIPTAPSTYSRYYDNIYAVLTQGAELAVKPEQAADVLRIIEAAQESAEKKCRIAL